MRGPHNSRTLAAVEAVSVAGAKNWDVAMPLKLVIVYATKFVGIASEVLRQGSTRVAEKATKVGVTEG